MGAVQLTVAGWAKMRKRMVMIAKPDYLKARFFRRPLMYVIVTRFGYSELRERITGASRTTQPGPTDRAPEGVLASKVAELAAEASAQDASGMRDLGAPNALRCLWR
jgi:hypothetical protein